MTTIQKFPYDKILTKLDCMDDLFEMAKLEDGLFNKSIVSTSSDRNKYMKLRLKVEQDLSKLNKKIGETEQFKYESSKGKKFEDLK